MAVPLIILPVNPATIPTRVQYGRLLSAHANDDLVAALSKLRAGAGFHG